MTPKIKKIIMFAGIGVALILVYFFFIKKGPDVGNLVSSTDTTATLPTTDAPVEISATLNEDFLAVLLNIKSIKLDDHIFSNLEFKSLNDSSINISPDGTEGRANPFAPIGSDTVENVAPKIDSNLLLNETVLPDVVDPVLEPVQIPTPVVVPPKTPAKTTTPKATLKTTPKTTTPKVVEPVVVPVVETVVPPVVEY